jgi:cell division protein FtsN
MAPAPVLSHRATIRICILCLGVLGGCSAEPPARMGPRVLPADSAAILATAVQRARPAYETQAEALRSGVYRSAPPVTAPPITAPPVTAPAATAPAGAAPQVAPPREPSPVNPPVAPTRGQDDAVVRRQQTSDPPPVTSNRSEAARAEYVVQIAAFRDLSSAERAAATARRDLPGMVVRIDEDTGLFRVSVGRWLDLAAAGLRLDEIREFYPSAWVRARPVP